MAKEKQKLPGFVIHDQKRWIVNGSFKEEGVQWYELQKNNPKKPTKPTKIVARVSECEPYIRPRMRTLKGDRKELVRLVVNADPNDKRISRRCHITTVGVLCDLLDRAAGERRLAEKEAARRRPRTIQ